MGKTERNALNRRKKRIELNLSQRPYMRKKYLEHIRRLPPHLVLAILHKSYEIYTQDYGERRIALNTIWQGQTSIGTFTTMSELNVFLRNVRKVHGKAKLS